MSLRKIKNKPPQRHIPPTPSNQPLIVVLSGFKVERKVELRHFLSKIPGVSQQDDMKYDVQVLVSNKIFNEKCNIANKMQVPIVTMQWVMECFKSQMILPTDDYLLGIFTGIKIGLLGFSNEEYNQINEFVVEENGETTRDMQELKDLTHSPNPNDLRNLIVVRDGAVAQNEQTLQDLKTVVCISEWLRQCFKRKCFVPHYNYQLHHEVPSDLQELYSEIREFPIEKAFSNIEEHNHHNYFQGCIVHIALKDDKLTTLLQRFISVGNGFFLSEILPIVTHVITLEHRTTSDQIHTLHPYWVRDSFRCRTRMVEADYTLRKITKGIPRLTYHDLDHQQTQSQTFGLGLQVESAQPCIRTLKFVEDNQPPRIKSKIFAGLSIYLQDHNRRLGQLIRENGGEIVAAPTAQRTVVILSDSPENPRILAKLNGVQYVFSERWVHYCLERRTIELHVQQKKLHHLMATNFRTPLDSLKGMFVYVSVVDSNDKVSFKEIAQVLTGVRTQKFVWTTVDILVCNKANSKKLQLIDKVKLRQPSWLIEMFTKGRC